MADESGRPIHLFGEPAGSDLLRGLEALLFAAQGPMTLVGLAERLAADVDTVETAIGTLQTVYANRGVNLVSVAGGWAFRTAPDLSRLMATERVEERRLSRAAMETLAIIAYHQPVTRAEIEEIRGVAVAKGTLDILLEAGWVRLRGRRRVPGRPVTFGTTPAFLETFGLPSIGDLPGLSDLRAAGLLEGTPPEGFAVPLPQDDAELTESEDPLDEEIAQASGAHDALSEDDGR